MTGDLHDTHRLAWKLLSKEPAEVPGSLEVGALAMKPPGAEALPDSPDGIDIAARGAAALYAKVTGDASRLDLSEPDNRQLWERIVMEGVRAHVINSCRARVEDLQDAASHMGNITTTEEAAALLLFHLKLQKEIGYKHSILLTGGDEDARFAADHEWGGQKTC